MFSFDSRVMALQNSFHLYIERRQINTLSETRNLLNLNWM